MTLNQENIEQLEAGIKLYSLHRAAKMLGLGRDTLLTLIDNGNISTIDVLGRKKISLAELISYTGQINKNMPVGIQTQRQSSSNNQRRLIENQTINKLFENIKKEVTSNEK